MNKITASLLVCLLLLLPACAKKYQSENRDMTPNLDPELSTDFLNIKRPRPLTEQEKKALASKTTIPFNLDVRDNEEVQMFLTYFTQERRDTMQRWLERAEPHLPYIRAVLATYKLPPDIIALPFIESGYNTMAYSPVGAGGMWQFMPATGRRFGLNLDWWEDERRNPYLATIAAAKYLSELHNMFGDWNLALAAYNCGEGKMSRVMAQSGHNNFFDIAKNPNLLKQETRHYVPKFLAVLSIFKNLEALGFKPVKWDDGKVFEEIQLPGGTDLAALAEASTMTWEEFHSLNPAFRRQVSPPDRPSPAYLPKDKKELALAYLANPSCMPNRGLRTFAAAPGDTWWTFSKRTGVPVGALRQMNPNLGDAILAEQIVVVPLDSSAQDTALASAGEDRPGRPAEARPAQSHRMKKGETLAQVARQYGVSKGDILKANNAKSESQLARAKTVTIPGGKVVACPPVNMPQTAAQPQAQPQQQRGLVEVRRGDTLSSLTQTHKVDPQALLGANGLKSGKDLKVGMRLSVPLSAQAAAKAPEPKPQDAKHADPKAAAKPQEHKPDPKAAVSKTPDPKAHTAQAAAKQPSVSYNVTSGETVWSIARKFKVDPHSLLAWNNLDKSVQLRPGDKLKIFTQ